MCAPSIDNVVECDAQVILIRKGAGLILAPRRHVQRWRDLSEAEQTALMTRIAPTQAILETDGALAPTTFVETEPHFHLRIETPAISTGPIPGAPHDSPLISGGEDALHAHLRPMIDQAKSVDLAVSFLMTSGAKLVLPHLRDLLERGGQLRLLTGDYLDVTEPTALRLMQDLDHDRQLYVFRAKRIAFHPKAWMFSFADGAGALIVGSSNLSRSALTEGVEWNLRHFDRSDALPLMSARTAFEDLLARPEVAELSPDWIDSYEARRIVPLPTQSGLPEETPEDAPKPHAIQQEALHALAATRAKGYRAGLVVLATGLGKTFLAAFDSQPAKRVLFVAHREEILTQAMGSLSAPSAQRHGLGALAEAQRILMRMCSLPRSRPCPAPST